MNTTVKWVLIGVAVAAFVGFLIGFVEGASGAQFGFLKVMVATFAGVFTAFIGLNLSGNRRGVQVAPSDARVALEGELPAGQGRLVVYREGFVGSMAGVNLAVDGQEMAQIKSPRFTVIRLSPGAHRLAAGFGGLAKAQNHQAEAEFLIQEGQTIAYRAVVSMGAIKNTIRLEQQDDLKAVGAALAKSRITAPDRDGI